MSSNNFDNNMPRIEFKKMPLTFIRLNTKKSNNAPFVSGSFWLADKVNANVYFSEYLMERIVPFENNKTNIVILENVSCYINFNWEEKRIIMRVVSFDNIFYKHQLSEQQTIDFVSAEKEYNYQTQTVNSYSNSDDEIEIINWLESDEQKAYFDSQLMFIDYKNQGFFKNKTMPDKLKNNANALELYKQIIKLDLEAFSGLYNGLKPFEAANKLIEKGYITLNDFFKYAI
ncbi:MULTISPECIES: hypothetical protein [Ureaplasma]|uniref:Uncharacterized protein UU155 n=4 Tax=Ureaplasma TaxID=2129 RepID=Y155_UREPA|nr:MULTISPECIES: hypothetical protein [Ureaplasma]Q9PQY9.1 RecName: Full=Uncharacterized protein UU155 [Ureaplasma parvum serovar 3 str. ATCC 700970]pir/D82928/ hypothetical protein UU155 [imported] - Ureaplasma urealyticum [Ureaplasma urealyticum]AAF30561.1 unique hypothetical [Ureaplasma parvum serovar 3 str. ATCC 700970]ACA33286.1 conserved hypothetical protein [Ureaplasma parvum serovar 3 str. ATCC 27815]EDU56638.1 conserved hypothetical protein [Ureaplasma urealyticum serovar 7 str. ATCC 